MITFTLNKHTFNEVWANPKSGSFTPIRNKYTHDKINRLAHRLRMEKDFPNGRDTTVMLVMENEPMRYCYRKVKGYKAIGTLEGRFVLSFQY